MPPKVRRTLFDAPGPAAALFEPDAPCRLTATAASVTVIAET